MVDIQQESVCLLAVEQRIRQNILIQVGKHSGNLLSKQDISAPAQQIVGDPVDPADDALFIHLDDAAERVVQQCVYLGRVVLFQINGVSHAGGSCKGIAQTFLPRRDKLVGQRFLPGRGADPVAADDGIAAILKRFVHHFFQLFFLLCHIKPEINMEQPVELGCVAEHIRKADQPDAGAIQFQFLFQIQHHTGQLLRGDSDLHERDADTALDEPCLHAARHDKVTALLFQFSGPLYRIGRADIFDLHHLKGRKFLSQRLCDELQLLIGHQYCYLCHRVLLLFWSVQKAKRRTHTWRARRFGFLPISEDMIAETP